MRTCLKLSGDQKSKELKNFDHIVLTSCQFPWKKIGRGQQILASQRAGVKRFFFSSLFRISLFSSLLPSLQL
ncbi:hypothetical protein Pfo_023840, partial [Paulownia fortunei]